MKDAVHDDGHGPASYALTLHFISQTGMTAAELAKKYQDNVLQQVILLSNDKANTFVSY